VEVRWNFTHEALATLIKTVEKLTIASIQLVKSPRLDVNAV
jgi:hypothetical protein